MKEGSATKILLWIYIFPILSFAFLPSIPSQGYQFESYGLEANGSQRNSLFKEKAELKAFSQNSMMIFPTVLKVKSEEEEGDDSKTTYFSPNIDLNAARKHKLSDAEDEEPTDQEIRESLNEYSFFDEATIYTRAGSGGQGSSTYKKGPGGQNGQPDGGDGGKGGDVIIVADDSLNTLAGLTRAWRPNAFGGGGAAAARDGYGFRPLSFRAENGHDGARQHKSGKFGKEVVITVPPGTQVQEEVDEFEIDEETGEKTLVRTELVDIGILSADDGEKTLTVAIGGEGGEGSGNQGYKKGRGVRRTRAPPVGGERKRLKLTLKIVADVALVGVPNAGKSTFLAAVTRAKPKIANYPFTTVIPNLGVWIPPNIYGDDEDVKASGAGSEGLALCDVPGLIAGAAEGVGLGHAFLRHVERCHVILHLVDATSNDPLGDFSMVNDEIMRYGNGKLAQMPQIVVVNKLDVWEKGGGEHWEQGLKTRMGRDELEKLLKEEMPHSRLMWMSAKEKDGVDDLMGRMNVFVKKVKASQMK
uniref:OBG-type G domain-containing protein n=1 Tax=Chaetoceros debilis TaxID=122233 RepID=A0A7S3PUF2_9STRA